MLPRASLHSALCDATKTMLNKIVNPKRTIFRLISPASLRVEADSAQYFFARGKADEREQGSPSAVGGLIGYGHNVPRFAWLVAEPKVSGRASNLYHAESGKPKSAEWSDWFRGCRPASHREGEGKESAHFCRFRDRDCEGVGSQDVWFLSRCVVQISSNFLPPACWSRNCNVRR
jgi:hypothetical protein